MADSLRDQLLKSGLVQKLKAEAKPAPAQQRHHPHKPKPQPGAKPAQPKPQGASGSDVDLARAYALRDKAEREERERLQREAEAKAKEKRERKEKLAKLLEGKALNRADADVPRHFPHGTKIRRVYCTAEQLAEVNRGELGIVQHNGRYLLVSKAVAVEVGQIEPACLVVLVDPNAPAEDDVPADLVW